jgi:hypothetical protein
LFEGLFAQLNKIIPLSSLIDEGFIPSTKLVPSDLEEIDYFDYSENLSPSGVWKHPWVRRMDLKL